MGGSQYCWNDTPDGQDIWKKLGMITKIPMIGGIGFFCFDMAMRPQPNLKGYAFRAAAAIVPPVGAMAAFTITSQLLCRSYPQVDPRFHYAAGAAVGSSVIGGALRSSRIGCVIAFYSSIIAYFIRDAMEYNVVGTTFLGNLPDYMNNDDEILAADYRFAPAFGSIPPPAARPARPQSDFANTLSFK